MRTLLIACVLSALAGAFLTYRLMPPKTEIRTQDKIVTQTQEKIITKVVKEPGGTVTITKEQIKVVDKKADKVSVSHVPSLKALPEYRVSALFSPDFQFKGAEAHRRIAGPLWGGVGATMKQEIYFSLSWEF